MSKSERGGFLSLTTKAEFTRVYREGKSWANNLLVVRASANDLSCNRYGLVVGKRLGGAVVRNRLKRRLREILRGMSLHQGWDIVCTGRSAAASANYPRLKQSLGELMNRGRVLEDRL